MAKQVLFLTQIFCRWTNAPAIAIACAADPSVPFNVIWFMDSINLFIDSWVPLSRKVITLVLNYSFWKIMTIQAFRLINDVLIGTMSLTYCLQVAHRYGNIIFRYLFL